MKKDIMSDPKERADFAVQVAYQRMQKNEEEQPLARAEASCNALWDELRDAVEQAVTDAEDFISDEDMAPERRKTVRNLTHLRQVVGEMRLEEFKRGRLDAAFYARREAVAQEVLAEWDDSDKRHAEFLRGMAAKKARKEAKS